MDKITLHAPQGAPRPLELCEAASQTPFGPPLMANLQALGGVALSLNVVVGQARITLAELVSLRPAQVLTIERAVDTAIDIMLDGQTVARGHLVVVGDHFGVRICERADLVS
jgi:flagellar motor switch protein FliN